jgi:hypothetical protein
VSQPRDWPADADQVIGMSYLRPGGRMGSLPSMAFAGIDRRTVKPALLVLALALVMSVVLPVINGETAYRDEVDPGDLAEVAAGITLVPTPGWDLAGGALVGHTRSPVSTTAATQFIDGSVNFDVRAAPFDGTASALLTRVNDINADLDHARGSGASTTNRYLVTTRQGGAGVAEDFVGVDRQGSIVAFVFKSPGQSIGEGVEIVVSGPKGAISRRRDDIVAMIRSVRTAP